MAELTYHSAKNDIWKAYKELMQKMQQPKLSAEESDKLDSGMAQVAEETEQIQRKQEPTFSTEEVINGIANLRTHINNALHDLSNKLTEEVEKLNGIRRTAAEENERLESVYQIKSQADTLLKLLEIQQQRKNDFEKKMADAEEKLQLEIDSRKKRLIQEEEDYNYTTRLKRRKEELDYELKREERERELLEREKIITQKETYIKDLEIKAAKFPSDLEKTVFEAKKQARERSEKESAIASSLREKEIEKDQALAQLRIADLEKTAAAQAQQITNLERQLAVANQKAQELALKTIEARKITEERLEKESREMPKKQD